MKAISVLLSLTAAVAVHSVEDAATSGSIRASRTAARGDSAVKYPVEKKKEKRVLNENQLKMHNDAYERHLSKKKAAQSESSTKENEAEQGERELSYKAKTGFSKLMWQDDGYRAGGRISSRPNNDKPGWMDDDDNRWGGTFVTRELLYELIGWHISQLACVFIFV